MSNSLNNPFSVAVSDRSSDTSLQSRQTTMGRYVELSIVQREPVWRWPVVAVTDAGLEMVWGRSGMVRRPSAQLC